MCFLSWGEHASVIVQHVGHMFRAGCLKMLNPLCTSKHPKEIQFLFLFSWISEILKKTPISIHFDVPKVVPKITSFNILQKQDYELFHKLIHQICGKKKKKKKNQNP